MGENEPTSRSRSSSAGPSRSRCAQQNTQSASARGAASAEAHLRSQDREKLAKYAAYYRNFVPVVIDLGGAVNDVSYGALKEIMREAANAAGPRLRWEKFDWAARLCSAASRSR